MGRALGFIGLLIAVGVGLYLYSKQSTSVPGGSPQAAIDTTAVKADLVAIAQAEKRHWASDGKYVDLATLRSNGDTNVPVSRNGYTYSVDASDEHFTVSADYSGPDTATPKHFSMDDSMQLQQ